MYWERKASVVTGSHRCGAKKGSGLRRRHVEVELVELLEVLGGHRRTFGGLARVAAGPLLRRRRELRLVRAGGGLLGVVALVAAYQDQARRQSEIERLTDPLSFRVFRLYLAGSAYEFRCGRLNIYQTLLAKPERGRSDLPLTRADWYRSSESTKTIPPQNSPLETIIKKITSGASIN